MLLNISWFFCTLNRDLSQVGLEDCFLLAESKIIDEPYWSPFFLFVFVCFRACSRSFTCRKRSGGRLATPALVDRRHYADATHGFFRENYFDHIQKPPKKTEKKPRENLMNRHSKPAKTLIMERNLRKRFQTIQSIPLLHPQKFSMEKNAKKTYRLGSCFTWNRMLWMIPVRQKKPAFFFYINGPQPLGADEISSVFSHLVTMCVCLCFPCWRLKILPRLRTQLLKKRKKRPVNAGSITTRRTTRFRFVHWLASSTNLFLWSSTFGPFCSLSVSLSRSVCGVSFLYCLLLGQIHSRSINPGFLSMEFRYSLVWVFFFHRKWVGSEGSTGRWRHRSLFLSPFNDERLWFLLWTL